MREKIEFYGGFDGREFHEKAINYLVSLHSDTIYAECPLPEGLTEENADEYSEYGFYTMKRAIQTQMKKMGIDPDDYDWGYESSDPFQYDPSSEPIAAADCPVYLEIKTDEDYESVRFESVYE